MIKRIPLVALAFVLLLTPSLAAAESISLSNPTSHSEPFAFCHSEGAKQPKNLTQDRLREESSAMFRIPYGDALSPSLVPFYRQSPELRLQLADDQSERDILVLDNSVEVHFPHELVFRLEAQSFSDIVDIRLHYQVNKMNYATVTSESWPIFTPATRIETSWAWDMRRAGLPPGAELTYWWAIEDRVGNRFTTSPNTAHFDDNRYHWQSLTTQDRNNKLSLFWYEGDNSFAQELMEVCEKGLARLIRDIGVYPENPIRIYIYASPRDLQGAMIFPMEWTGGAAFTEFGIIAIGISQGQHDWGKRALVHELTHLVVHQATFSPYGMLPTWLDEGLAMYNEGEADPYQFWLKRAISEDKLISVRSLCSPFSADPEKAYISYAESYSLVEYLLDNYGQEKMLSLLTLFKEGTTYDEALIQVYGFDIEGLDARWRETLVAPTVVTAIETKAHAAVIAVLSALATALALAGALALEERTWRGSGKKS